MEQNQSKRQNRTKCNRIKQYNSMNRTESFVYLNSWKTVIEICWIDSRCWWCTCTCSVNVSSRCVIVVAVATGSEVECVSGMPMSEHPSISARSAENPSLCTRTLRTDMRRGIPLSRTEFRIFWKFLLSWYWRNAVWILQAARREIRGPPYFCSSSSICR